MCSVENTRWPVSAAVSAISIVSRSRISPTRITFGACRSAARSASANVGVSLCSSRWCTVAFLVQMQELDRIFDREDVLGARLVDQVDDRGQRRRLARSGRTGDEHDAVLAAPRSRQATAGRFRSASDGIFVGDDAHHDREGAALAEDVDAEARAVGQRIREVARALLLQRAQRMLVAANQIARDPRRVVGLAASAAPGRRRRSARRASRPAAAGLARR